jgi:hypothetical protein
LINAATTSAAITSRASPPSIMNHIMPSCIMAHASCIAVDADRDVGWPRANSHPLMTA